MTILFYALCVICFAFLSFTLTTGGHFVGVLLKIVAVFMLVFSAAMLIGELVPIATAHGMRML